MRRPPVASVLLLSGKEHDSRIRGEVGSTRVIAGWGTPEVCLSAHLQRHGEARYRRAFLVPQGALYYLDEFEPRAGRFRADVGFAVPVAVHLGLLPALA